ncbi:hypothetical protein HMPREF9099_01782 [Lachnospiraceae bacterium oral taxon 082 str. F0431]|nr:hypothetical protein HMPREF9099_01782 [Lachnospiraceae bacterium oral taxon 082 str. F0431]
MRKEGKLEFSKVELAFKDAIRENDMLTNLEFKSLDANLKE